MLLASSKLKVGLEKQDDSSSRGEKISSVLVFNENWKRLQNFLAELAAGSRLSWQLAATAAEAAAAAAAKLYFRSNQQVLATDGSGISHRQTH